MEGEELLMEAARAAVPVPGSLEPSVRQSKRQNVAP